MSRDDIARLLGGYATGTLTPEEQEALFAAALEDQALFDELAREQALRDVLSEPAARAQLLAALEDHPRWYQRISDWMLRPAALTAAAACLVVVGVVAIWRPWHENEATKPDLLATALPQEARRVPSSPAIVEEKERALPAMRAAAKAVPPLSSPAKPVAASPAESAVKKELSFAETASHVLAVEPANKPSAEIATAMVAASPPPPPPAKTMSPKMTDLASTARDAAVQIAPGASGGAAAGRAAPVGALSANGAEPNNAASMRSDSDARQRYYAGKGLAAVEPKAQTQEVEMARASENQPAPLGIKWNILRRQADGAFAIANAEDLRAGDTVELRLVANQSCDLAVFDNAGGNLVALFAKHVEAGETYITPPLAPREKGLRKLVVGLTRSGNVVGDVAGAQPAASLEGQQSETDRRERATYTVGPAGAQRVFLSITLNYQ